MSPVGSGLTFYDDPFPISATRDTVIGPRMRLDENRVNLYRDIRAMTVGDVVTVTIAMDDKAILGNSTDRSRDAKVKSKWSLLMDFVPALGGADGTQAKAKGDFSNEITSSTSTQGHGSINRSEQIRFSIAAVVTSVLPNGNLVLHGSQEMRVNHELRVVTVAGVARPRDISKDNVIAYDKIAEARVSYGGRGRLTEVQQPAWGQQLYDIVSPF